MFSANSLNGTKSSGEGQSQKTKSFELACVIIRKINVEGSFVHFSALVLGMDFAQNVGVKKTLKGELAKGTFAEGKEGN